MKILIYIEEKDGEILNSSLELISAASLGEGTAVLVGGSMENARKTAAFGIDAMALDLKASGADADFQDAVLYALEQAAEKTNSQLILFAATPAGKDLAPRLAARLETGCVTDVMTITPHDEVFKFIRPAYGGSILETMTFAVGKPMVASVRSGSFKRPEQTASGNVSVEPVSIPDKAVKARLVEKAVELTEMVNLEGAEVIAAGGRGCGDAATFGLVRELAELLGGVVGASRPAMEEGWVSRAHQIGQSGKIVAPKLYIACGISGAMQHISGIIGSDYIVAINKDEDAPIFEIADISIVGRCEEILPLLVEAVRARKA